jgi:hypothetical protein
MNVRDWTGDSTNNTLHSVMILMGSASAAIIVVALAAAFFPLWIGGAGERARKLQEKVKASTAAQQMGKIISVQHPQAGHEEEEESVEGQEGMDGGQEGETR